MRTIHYTSQFKKDVKLAQRRGRNLDRLKKIIAILARGEILDARFRDHDLLGQY